MGVRVAGVILATSFLLGILFTHWIADSLTLWQSPLTDDHLRTAAIYYSLFATLPQWMTWVLLAVAALGAASLLASFKEGEAGNVMFDGASIFLYLCTLYVYWSSVLPNLSEVFSKPLPRTESIDVPFPDDLRQPTIELASSHLICSVALTGILLLQTGRYWADSEDRSEREQDEKEEAAEEERRRLESEATRGRRRHAEDEDDENVPIAALDVPAGVRKSVSARRDKTRSAASKTGSIGRSSGTKVRRGS